MKIHRFRAFLHGVASFSGLRCLQEAIFRKASRGYQLTCRLAFVLNLAFLCRLASRGPLGSSRLPSRRVWLEHRLFSHVSHGFQWLSMAFSWVFKPRSASESRRSQAGSMRLGVVLFSVTRPNADEGWDNLLNVFGVLFAIQFTAVIAMPMPGGPRVDRAVGQ